jgi:hypothetical protein
MNAPTSALDFMEPMKFLTMGEHEYSVIWQRIFNSKNSDTKQSRIDSLLLLSRCKYKHELSPRLFNFLEGLIKSNADGTDGVSCTALSVFSNLLANPLCEFSQASKELESLVNAVITYATANDFKLTYRHETDPIEPILLRCVQLMTMKLCTEYRQKTATKFIPFLSIKVKNVFCCTMPVLRAIACYCIEPKLVIVMSEMGMEAHLQRMLKSRRENDTDVPCLNFILKSLEEVKSNS